MKAIIPVAGAGTRLRPHTHSTPKVLIHVAGKPILGHILDQLASLPIDEVVIVIGHMGEKIREYVDAHYAFKTSYVVQESQRGLADAIYLTRKAVGDSEGLIILGDTVFRTDFKRIVAKRHGQIGVKQVDDPRRFGVVELDGRRITRLVEKPERPRSNLAIVGIYLIQHMGRLYSCIEQLMAKRIRTKGEYQLTDALQLLIERGEQLEAFTVDGWYDCGKPETLLETNRQLLGLHAKAPARGAGVVYVPPVFVDPAATVERSIIGPYVSIAAGSTVRNAIVSDSIIGANVGLDTINLRESIIGDNAVIHGRQRKLNVGDASEVDLS